MGSLGWWFRGEERELMPVCNLDNVPASSIEEHAAAACAPYACTVLVEKIRRRHWPGALV